MSNIEAETGISFLSSECFPLPIRLAVTALHSLLALFFVAIPAVAQDVRHTEQVEVRRVVIDARVTNEKGEPIPGLGRDDFAVKIDGKPVRVDTATWVTGGIDEFALRAMPFSPAQTVDIESVSPGRLIVFFFQKGMEPSRITGLMKMLIEARQLAESLDPGDYVAVLSFDSHLKLWLDFSRDRERLDAVLERSILFGGDRVSVAGTHPSLATHLSERDGRNVSSVEKGLELTARALESFPGSKSLVLFGWGFGRLTSMGVVMEADYEPARLALQKARVTVFSMDVTQADYHSLEAGLKSVASDTGGFFARTHLFPSLAMARLQNALEGHYVLMVEGPEGRRGVRRIEVSLVGRKGNVLARSWYVD
jgi:VWFA-related protein